MQKAKTDFKNKVEQQFCTNNPKQAWEGLNRMMGRERKEPVDNFMDLPFLNDLNSFYGRFDSPGNKAKCNAVLTNTPQTTTIHLSVEEVRHCLSRTNPHKAPGPDGLRGRALKACANELAPVFTYLFQLLLSTCTVPNMWKSSVIKPLPKKPGSKELNDFRPVALTPILAKCMERVVIKHLTASLNPHLDPMQFAYKPHRGTEDATLSLTNMLTKHLHNAKAYAQILFIDFTAAFNTMQIHILLQRLLDLGADGGLVHWIKDFLTDRPQRVCTRDLFSEELILNTGAPQGCCLSPLLFSVYTNEMSHCTTMILSW